MPSCFLVPNVRSVLIFVALRIDETQDLFLQLLCGSAPVFFFAAFSCSLCSLIL